MPIKSALKNSSGRDCRRECSHCVSFQCPVSSAASTAGHLTFTWTLSTSRKKKKKKKPKRRTELIINWQRQRFRGCRTLFAIMRRKYPLIFSYLLPIQLSCRWYCLSNSHIYTLCSYWGRSRESDSGRRHCKFSIFVFFQIEEHEGRQLLLPGASHQRFWSGMYEADLSW